ncbi:MAG: DNA primase [Bacteroidales bacterium]|nr:DNA primase [Bacteroidales bacterium]
MIKRESIDAIVAACRIEEVVGDYVHLAKRGVNFIGLCPFHDEKTPSFIVSPAKGIYKCFGCGEAGDSIRFMMQHEHYSYVEALRYLAKKYGIQVEETEQTPEALQQLNEREALFAVSEFAAGFFARNLLQTKEGQAVGLSYFRERGFTDETIAKFRLGYSLPSRSSLTDEALKQGYTLENLEKAGLVSRSGEKTADRFFDRVMFPIQNFSGKVIAFGGRTLRTDDKKTAKYINSPETDIYHKSDTLYGIYQAKNAIRKADKCLLVEGYADVISMHQSGIEHVVASSGTSLTTNQVKLIGKLTRNVTVLYDGDAAGIHAAERAVGLMLKEGLNMRIAVLPPEDDPDTFARKHTRQEILDYIAEKEKDFLGFRIARFLEQPDHLDPLKKSDFVRAVAADLALIPDAITLSVMVKQSCEMLDVAENALLSEVNRLRVKRYVEERRRSQGRPEEGAEAEVSDAVAVLAPEEPKERPVELESVLLTLPDAEKAVLSRLVNYGEREITLDAPETGGEPRTLRVDELVFQDLESDGLEISTPQYREFYQLYKECLEKDAASLRQQLQAVPDENLHQLYMSLLDMRPQVSPQWKKYKSSIHTIDDSDTELLQRDLQYVLQTFRMLHLRNMKRQCTDALKTETDAEESALLLYKIQQINQLISVIERKLGVTYR